ncbi:MAG TPA: hypothetical protein VL752_01065 [Acidisoma sp.]|uniref:hypothetical protein n=1 Tax=Acidisoma sp. TaxID=1872115 RepID=UPI002C16ABE0|nr:hypothetical protein [Acidisoma sp.]HTH99507.1 hypothetical protein [Acidisoma sp.]
MARTNPATAMRPAAVLGNSLTAALWIAVCAATPEFIWRGARVVSHHFSWADAAAALMIGLILAFCIEPAMERARNLLFGGKQEGHRQYSPLFAAAAGIAFGLASVCLHDAITSFLALHAEEHAVRHAGLVNGLRIALSWAVVPFFTTLAWLAAARRRLVWPMGLLGVLSPVGAAWVFSWSASDTLTTFIPCTAFLALGYRALRRGPTERLFPQAARSIAWAGPLWLAAAVVVDGVLVASHVTGLRLYNGPELWVDARFYAGWCMGLLLAPFPFGRGSSSARS